MDNSAMELSLRSDGHDGNANSTKSKRADGLSEEEVFGPPFSVLDDMKRLYQKRVAILSIVACLIGATVGAAIAVIVFTNTGENAVSESNLPEMTAASNTSTYDPVNCPASYNGTCYKAVQHLDVNRTKANELCTDIGWKLANIYSTSHYYMLEGYLRATFPHNGYVSAWTGMSMIPEDKQLVLSNGENITIPGIPWHKGYPSQQPIYVSVGIDALRKPEEGSEQSQGLWNYNPSWRGNTAICEQT